MTSFHEQESWSVQKAVTWTSSVFSFLTSASRPCCSDFVMMNCILVLWAKVNIYFLKFLCYFFIAMRQEEINKIWAYGILDNTRKFSPESLLNTSDRQRVKHPHLDPVKNRTSNTEILGTDLSPEHLMCALKMVPIGFSSSQTSLLTHPCQDVVCHILIILWSRRGPVLCLHSLTQMWIPTQLRHPDLGFSLSVALQLASFLSNPWQNFLHTVITLFLPMVGHLWTPWILLPSI